MRPSVNPITGVHAAIGSELDISRQDAPKELSVIHHLETRAGGLYRESVNSAVRPASAEIAEEKMVAIIRRKSGAGIMGQARRAAGDVPHRRDDIRRLAGKLEV